MVRITSSIQSYRSNCKDNAASRARPAIMGTDGLAVNKTKGQTWPPALEKFNFEWRIQTPGVGVVSYVTGVS